jgi:hypothetical protein
MRLCNPGSGQKGAKSQRLLYPQESSRMLTQHPVRRHFASTRAHPAEQTCPGWGHIRRQVLYRLEHVVADAGPADATATIPEAAMNRIARDNVRTIAFLPLTVSR